MPLGPSIITATASVIVLKSSGTRMVLPFDSAAASDVLDELPELSPHEASNRTAAAAMNFPLCIMLGTLVPG